jgi:GNAT superfamily N-acetyltransferase
MVTLRLATPEDAKGVRAVGAAAADRLTWDFGPGHWSRARSLETIRKYIGQRTQFVAVEPDETIVGSFKLTTQKIGFYRGAWFAEPKAVAGYLTDMAVHPDRQRQGVGRAMMAQADELARALGMTAIRLDAYDGPSGAGRFYEKCGYRLVHKGEISGTALEYFERVLG